MLSCLFISRHLKTQTLCGHMPMHFTSSQNADFLWSHAYISMHSFVITQARLYSMLTCSCTSHVHALHMSMHSYIICCHLPICVCILLVFPRLIVHVHMFLKFVKCQILNLSICKHVTVMPHCCLFVSSCMRKMRRKEKRQSNLLFYVLEWG